jgi:hypothetical protein
MAAGRTGWRRIDHRDSGTGVEPGESGDGHRPARTRAIARGCWDSRYPGHRPPAAKQAAVRRTIATLWQSETGRKSVRFPTRNTSISIEKILVPFPKMSHNIYRVEIIQFLDTSIRIRLPRGIDDQ